MKNYFVFSLFLLLIFFTGCSTPGTDSSDNSSKKAANSIILTQIDLRLAVGTNVSGTLTIELRDATGSTPALWSNTINTSTLHSGAGSYWNSFTVPDIELTNKQTYRIYVTRSDAQDIPNSNTISWNSSDSGDDEYTQGFSSSGNSNIDFTFRIFDDGIVNQQMESVEYGYSVFNTGYLWQEFVPES
ncbi:MAG: hypothetical protein MJB14_06800 [Spirochaetes bacterium]|nr:hypothetical protein [Spirochaetota bacterium]